jgi:hypothetical protein
VDEEENCIYAREVRGVRICAIVAIDDGSTVITVYDRRA